jgi:alpha-beta hydrolase superfamily lysophospholipase
MATLELKAGLAEHMAAPEWLEPKDGPAKGMRLAFRAYTVPQPRAHVLISHGFAEHSGWWQHVALAFQARGYSAYLFDHFHHGQSAGRVADVPHYNVLTAGIRCALEQGVLPRAKGAPVILFGHSNGGCASLFGLPQFKSQIQALVLSSPLIRMSWMSQWAGWVVASAITLVNPGAYWPLPLDPRRLTSVPELWPTYLSDPLRFHKISGRFYLAMRAATLAVSAMRDTCGVPLLLLTAGDDRVVNLPETHRWYARLTSGERTHLDHPHRQHELFNEVDWQKPLEEVIAWIEARFPAR